jgi:hypothetical protein
MMPMAHLKIDDQLLAEAKQLGGHRTKSATVIEQRRKE